MWPFRPPETTPNRHERHETVLAIIEEMAGLRGRLRSIESEWDDMRAQIRKGYMRMEKAYERQQEARAGAPCPEEEPAVVGMPAAQGFAEKLRAFKQKAG